MAANEPLPSITFDVEDPWTAAQLGQQVGETVSRFEHVDLPRNPNGFWRGVDDVLKMQKGTIAAVSAEFTGNYAVPQDSWEAAGYAIGIPLAMGAQIITAEAALGAEAIEGLYQGSQRAFGSVTGQLEKWGFFGKNGAESLYHTVTSPGAGQGVLNKIDPRFFNTQSRFGKAFYVSEVPDTTLAELEHHNSVGVDTIRFNFNRKPAKILDLTKPRIAQKWGYVEGDISSATKDIGLRARESGFNVIRYPSERGPGSNLAIFNDFENLLQPKMVVPTPRFDLELELYESMNLDGAR